MPVNRSRTRSLRLLPGVDRLRHYDRAWLGGDLLAGATVAAYLIPQVMAYAQVAGLPAVTGLWATIGALLVYAVLGSSPQLSVGPESTTALMTAVALGGVAAGDPGRYAALAGLLAILVGATCLVAWVGRLGFLAELLSRPVLVGYMLGVAVIMIVGQLGRLTGIRVPSGGPLSELADTATHLGAAHLPTVFLAGAVLVFLFAVQAWLPRVPGPLVGMLLAAAAVALFDLKSRGIAVVGNVASALPHVQVPHIGSADVVALLPAALGITMVAYSDNVLTGRAFATRGSDAVDNNQELLALGAANVAAGMSQGFPVSSSGSRTAIGNAAGSHSQLYSLAALAVVLVVVTVLGPVLAAFPNGALGAVVVYAATRLVDVSELRRMAGFRRTELYLAVGTTVGVLILGVLQGVLFAIALSVLDLLHRVARPHDGVLAFVPGLAGMHDVDDYPQAQQVAGLVVYRYDSPLFFANAQDFLRRALLSAETSPTPPEWFLLNAEANVSVDITALDALHDLQEELGRRGITLAMARVKQDLRADLERGGFIQCVGEDRVFATLPTAVQAYVEWYRERHGTTPAGYGGA
jgi:SulP family sulfate permease